jgi:hypothetical protein
MLWHRDVLARPASRVHRCAGGEASDRKETKMRKVIVYEWITHDGVVQAPGAADEDTTGGFEHGATP